MESSGPGVGEVLSLLERERGMRLSLVRRFERGDEGAYEVVDATGRRLVLKWAPWRAEDAEAAGLVTRRLERLRGRGGPIPLHVAQGRAGDVLFEVQEAAEGQPVEEVTELLLDQMVSVVDMQRDMGLGEGGDWWEFLTRGLFEDRSPLCRPSVLADRVGAVAHLVTRVRTMAVDVPPSRQAPNDVVHFDFGPANLLADHGRLTAVLDWRACRDGDAGYDLITTDWDLMAWPKARASVIERLAEEIIRTTASQATALYAAHTVMRNLTWAVDTEWEDHIVRTGHRFLDRWSTR